MKNKQVVGIVIAAIVFVLVGTAGVLGANSLRRDMSSIVSFTKDTVETVPANSVAVVDVTGEISSSASYATGYNHAELLDYINDMRDSSQNAGLLLYIDSPGGEAYAGDELYDALTDYREQTGRPIWAYGGSMVASAAYNIACTADKIAVNRSSWVGSIGVYISYTDMKGLYDMLGIKPTYIKSGANKAMGNGYDPLTEEQYAIYQGLVDDCYEDFLSHVAEARGYTDRARLLELCDGRVYTAKQSLDNGLIDEITDYEEFKDSMLDSVGASGFYARASAGEYWWDTLFTKAQELLPRSDTQLMLEQIEKSENGELMMKYVG